MAVEKGIDTELPVGTVQAEQVQITETPLKEGQVELYDGSMIVGDVSQSRSRIFCHLQFRQLNLLK